MALHFITAKNQRAYEKGHHDNRSVELPEKIQTYLYAHKNDFSAGVQLLLPPNNYCDAVLYDYRIKQLLEVCTEIQTSTEDYSIYGKCKPFGIKKEELQAFQSALSELCKYAYDSGGLVFSVGD